MATILLGVGDLGVSNTPGDVVKTLALGSCVSVVMLEARSRTVGMVHVALPESSIDKNKAESKPGYFADTGIQELMRQMKQLSGSSSGKGFIVKLVGGASVMDPNNTFNIGKRNLLAIRKILWSQGMGSVAEDVGGHISRSVVVDVDNGKVVIISAGRGTWEI
ncbi:MAG: chemotaxis protein CheD [Pseudomonadota bacterium]